MRPRLVRCGWRRASFKWLCIVQEAAGAFHGVDGVKHPRQRMPDHGGFSPGRPGPVLILAALDQKILDDIAVTVRVADRSRSFPSLGAISGG